MLTGMQWFRRQLVLVAGGQGLLLRSVGPEAAVLGPSKAEPLVATQDWMTTDHGPCASG